VAKSPTLNNIEFDAVLEDTFEASVELTGYEIELGARASDHRIIKPRKWTITAIMSNTPLQARPIDFVGGAFSNTIDSGVVSTVSGLSAGFLAGDNETRSSAALEEFLNLMTTGEPFDCEAGDISLINMIISNIRRTKDATNEGGLIVEIELQEYPTLQTTLSNNQPIASQLNQNDPSASQASAVNNRGEIRGLTPSSATNDLVNEVTL
jgi:hypothetical protein